MRLVLLGAPGSGKGTQGQRLSQLLKVPEISTGNILRAAVAAKTPLGRAAKTVMDAGQLVSDEIMLGVLRERLMKADARKGFILDGFPRNLAQAEALDELLGQIGQPIDLALVINVDTDWLLQRMVGRRSCRSCGAVYNIYTAPPKMDDRCDECGGRLRQRADDTEETIGNRLRIYETQTAPVITRYQEQDKLRSVQGVGSVDDVFKAVRKIIEDEKRTARPVDRSATIRNAVARRKTDAESTARSTKQAKAGKKAAAKKKTVIKNKSAAKKATAKKKTAKKKTAKQKITASSKAASRKKAVKRKVVKKKVVKKKVVKKKARKKTIAKKTVKKKASGKKVATKKAATRSAGRKKTSRR